MMHIALRVDSSSAMGTGHLMRCLTLAEALRARGASCTFICRDLPGNLSHLVQENGFGLRRLPAVDVPVAAEMEHIAWLQASVEQDQVETRLALNDQQWDWLVVDHYGVDEKWERGLRAYCKQILVLDDLADRIHDCDLLWDPGAEPDLKERHAKAVPSHAMLLTGPAYALLRPEFDAQRASLPPAPDRIWPRHLLVMFGGNDADGHTLEAVQAVRRTAPAGTPVDVVVSTINQDQGRLHSFCLEHDSFKLHVASTQVAALLARADLVIASGGGATWERLYLRRPALLKIVAENQRKPLEYMAGAGYFVLYDTAADLQRQLQTIFTEGVAVPPDIVRNGVPALCDLMLKRLVSLGKVRSWDLRRSFRWLQDAQLRQSFLMRGDAPTRRDHFLYWRRLLSDSMQRVYSIRQARRHRGHAGLRNIDLDAGEAELWLYLGSSNQRGMGIGRMALSMLEARIRNELGCYKAVLHVSRKNLPAYGLYCAAGYRLSSKQEAVEAGFQAHMDVVRMEKTL
jgi:UDP-2,4-diacetamido-2,4,6-trideoxy-beta-L-altropyranose hydrolase